MADLNLSGNRTHDANLLAAHNVLQAVYKTAANQAAVKAGELVFFRTALASAKAQGLTAVAQVYAEAIWELTGQYS